MGCFDYECECNGQTCAFQGGQGGGNSDVIIEIPLNDGTTIHVKGCYEQYGSVQVGNYQFYPEQFRDYFEGWLTYESENARSKIFLAGRIWTYSYYKYDDANTYGPTISECCPSKIKFMTDLGNDLVKKLVRADKDLNIP